MTLTKGNSLQAPDIRQGGSPFSQQQQNLHRRSMPVDALELLSTASPGRGEELCNLVRCSLYGSSERNPDSSVSESSDSAVSSGGDSVQLHKVVLLGEHGVGKSSLARVFGDIDDGHDGDEIGNMYTSSVIVDEEEATILLFDIWEQDNSPLLKEQCMQLGDAYIIVYSVTDKASFEKASELRIQLRRTRQSENIPIILVGNKSDLVRSREVSLEEGRACAVVFDCKFIETSASLQHHVWDLFEGVVRQIRLRRGNVEESTRHRRQESISRKAKRFIGRMVARQNQRMAFRQKSKSCHDLTVL